ncbi:MAG: ABC transporter permease subunit [Paracoccus sp. (in: a-proteobacteria)]|uniref:ABC transporter permease n=1 Tax=Paracoccus sp. TaxID=267 RepID=UPI0039E6CDED
MRRGTRLFKTALNYIYATLFLSFLLFPLVVVVPASFSEGRILNFPPKGFTLDWFEKLFTNRGWSDSFFLSLQVAGLAALVTVVCAMMLGLAQYRYSKLGQGMWVTAMLPMFVPNIIVATGLFTILLNLERLGNPVVLSLADATAALPLAVALMMDSFGRLSPNLWFAASSLGAKPTTVLRRVLMPEIMVPMLSAMVLSFAHAFDEVTFAVFIGVGNSQVLPARMYSYMIYQVDPILPAVGTVLFTVAILCTLLVPLIRAVQRAVLSAQRRRTQRDMAHTQPTGQ